MMRVSPCIAILGMLLGMAALSSAPAQELVEEYTTLREMMDGSVEEFTVFPSAEADEHAKTIVALRWANNARGSEDGLTLLYTHQGRPIAAACVYPWDKRVVHDFESLSGDKIIGKRGEEVVWQPQTSGVEFAPIPEAPAPAATAAQRLRQIKTLAEQFQSTMLGWKADSTDREEFRLLTKPLYRYQTPEESEIIDGAVFGFAMGTDPESLLMIEAVRDKGAAQWRFAFARRTSGELEGRYKDKIVWKAARYPQNRDPKLPHYSVTTPIPAALLAPPSE